MRQFVFLVLAIGLGLLPFTTVARNAADRNFSAPAPPVDASLAAGNSEQTAVLAGGCFWGIQAVFQHVNGVITATSGYSGGSSATAQYEMVSTGDTGHAESVKITYDPSQITYRRIYRRNDHSVNGMLPIISLSPLQV